MDRTKETNIERPSFEAHLRKAIENESIEVYFHPKVRVDTDTIFGAGVEKEHQKEFLLSKNCVQMQGFLFSKPLSSTDFERVLMEKDTLKFIK